MNQRNTLFVRQALAGILAVLLTAPIADAAPLLEYQQETAAQSAPSEQQQTPQSAPASADQPQGSVPSNAPALEQRPQSASPQPQPENVQQGTDTKPVGTAAAPVTRPTGVAGSRPAGAVIAPGKQRRVRRILVRVGIIVGAGVAVGVVAGLSRGSSSRP